MIEIRKVKSYDELEAIEKLALEILPETYHSVIAIDHIHFLIKSSHSADAINNLIQKGNSAYYLLFFNKIPVGYLGIEYIKDALILSKIYILKSFRGKGIGKTALMFIVELAVSAKASNIELVVHKLNVKSIDFYRDHSFDIIESLSHVFNNGLTLEGYRMLRAIE